MPRKTFVAGEVLLAQDVNQFLMDQSVMNFASSAARSSAIPTPTEGMVAVTLDNDELQYYNGTSWATGLPFGAWKTYTPVVTATSGTITSFVVNEALYAQIGKTVHLVIDLTVTNNGTGSGVKQFTLPVNARTGVHTGSGLDVVTGNALVVFLAGNAVRCALFNFTYPNATTRSSITYEAA